MAEEKDISVEETKAAEASAAVESTENQKTESGNVSEEALNAIRLQAARYAYIEKLENRLANEEHLTPRDINDVIHCKAQVLLELVGVSGYAAHISADSPNRMAVDTLIKHLYKCYDKTEQLRDKIMKNINQKRSKKQWEDFTLLSRPHDKFYIYRDEFLLPQNNVINLTNIGLTAGTAGMLSQLIKNPSESIKAQMPDLIEEFASKITGTDKETTHKYINSLLEGLSNLKNPKSITAVLESIGSLTTMLSLKHGKMM